MRSGTTHVARLLSAAGLSCGHETSYLRWTRSYEPVSEPITTFGDSVAAAAPVAGTIASRSVLVHLLRPPLDVISSIVVNRLLAERRVPHVAYIARHVPRVLEEPPGPRRAARYWLDWQQVIEPHADLCWDLTEIGPDQLHVLSSWIGADITHQQAVDACASVPRANRWRDPNPVSLTDLGRLGGEVRERAAEYGVPLTERQGPGCV